MAAATATARVLKRSAFSSEESSLSESTSTREEEKTIPFLRRLSDMLLENDDVISFYPGNQTNGRVVLGRIVVHDRHKVESDVLPRYFNHASFASLRRQLNYFNFTRMGKGRQRGATYCNEAVIELSDILRLKRKSVTPSASGVPVERHSGNLNKTGLDDLNYISSVVPVVHLAPSREEDRGQKKVRSKKRKLSASGAHTLPFPHLSPIHHSVSDDDTPAGPVLSVDFTSRSCYGQTVKDLPNRLTTQPQSIDNAGADMCGDEDILAGCSVLLSFCNAKIASA